MQKQETDTIYTNKEDNIINVIKNKPKIMIKNSTHLQNKHSQNDRGTSGKPEG